MATHAPIMGAPTRAPFPSHPNLPDRAAIEQEIERLIAVLDAADGDPDCEDGDPDTSVEDGPHDVEAPRWAA